MSRPKHMRWDTDADGGRSNRLLKEDRRREAERQDDDAEEMAQWQLDLAGRWLQAMNDGATTIVVNIPRQWGHSALYRKLAEETAEP